MSRPRVVGALLAAGASRRLGAPKQLLPWRGVSLVRALATELGRAHTELNAVVLGHECERVRGALAGLRLSTIRCLESEQGIAASIRAAVAWADAQQADGIVLCACDQPFLTPAHLNALIRASLDHACAAASAYAGIRGIPAAFPRAWFPALLALGGDREAGALLRARADLRELAWDDGAFDVDTEADLRRVSVEAAKRSVGVRAS